MGTDARAVFASIDAMDADAFVAHLTPGVAFRFGNADALHGRAAVAEAVSGFWTTIGGLTHHVREQWDVDATTRVFRIDVEYLRHDGRSVTVPNVDILRYDGDLVADWQILIDLAPVYADPVGV